MDKIISQLLFLAIFLPVVYHCVRLFLDREYLEKNNKLINKFLKFIKINVDDKDSKNE